MKSTRLYRERIGILREGELRPRRRIGSIGRLSAAFYKWKPKYGSLGISRGAGRQHSTPHFVCHFKGDGSPLRPVRLVRTDGANVDGVLIAGNPAAGRRPG